MKKYVNDPDDPTTDSPTPVPRFIYEDKVREVAALQAKLVKARKALQRYGRHDNNYIYCESAGTCICGLTKARKEISE